MARRTNTLTRFFEDVVDSTKDLVDDLVDRAKDVETDVRDAAKNVVDDEDKPKSKSNDEMGDLHKAIAELTAKVNALAGSKAA